MAAQTTWHPRTNYTPKSWLLTNGEIVQEPPLEETASGRKVRIAGTTLSMFAKDVDELVYKGVESIAKVKGVEPWMAINPDLLKQSEQIHYDKRLRSGKRPELHLLNNIKGYGQDHSTIWFRFRHHTLPLEAVLVIELRSHRYGGRVAEDVYVDVSLLQPNTNPDGARSVELIRVNDNDFDTFRNRIRDHAKRQKIADLLRDDKPEWLEQINLGESNTRNDRSAVKLMRKAIQEADGLSSIKILDMRDVDKPAWLELDLYDTNLTGEFQQSLSDYLDGSGVVAEIKGHYDEIRRLFRSSGIVLADRAEGDWSRALAGGEAVEVQVESTPNGPDNTMDHGHTVVLHMPTGSVVVNCSNRKASKDEIAHKWEESLTMASLTGQEDVLLAYAKRYVETSNQRRVEQIIEERRVDLDE